MPGRACSCVQSAAWTRRGSGRCSRRRTTGWCFSRPRSRPAAPRPPRRLCQRRTRTTAAARTRRQKRARRHHQQQQRLPSTRLARMRRRRPACGCWTGATRCCSHTSPKTPPSSRCCPSCCSTATPRQRTPPRAPCAAPRAPCRAPPPTAQASPRLGGARSAAGRRAEPPPTRWTWTGLRRRATASQARRGRRTTPGSASAWTRPRLWPRPCSASAPTRRRGGCSRGPSWRRSSCCRSGRSASCKVSDCEMKCVSIDRDAFASLARATARVHLGKTPSRCVARADDVAAMASLERCLRALSLRACQRRLGATWAGLAACARPQLGCTLWALQPAAPERDADGRSGGGTLADAMEVVGSCPPAVQALLSWTPRRRCVLHCSPAIGLPRAHLPRLMLPARPRSRHLCCVAPLSAGMTPAPTTAQARRGSAARRRRRPGLMAGKPPSTSSHTAPGPPPSTPPPPLRTLPPRALATAAVAVAAAPASTPACCGCSCGCSCCTRRQARTPPGATRRRPGAAASRRWRSRPRCTPGGRRRGRPLTAARLACLAATAQAWGGRRLWGQRVWGRCQRTSRACARPCSWRAWCKLLRCVELPCALGSCRRGAILRKGREGTRTIDVR